MTTALATKSEPCGRCGQTFSTLEEVFSHDCPDSKFVRQPNGFGGTTTVRRPTPSTTKPVSAATDRQEAFLATLLSERSGSAVEAIRQAITSARADGSWSKAMASSTIDRVMKLPKSTETTVRTPRPGNFSHEALAALPEGRYFVAETFVRVDHPTEGRWANFVFVKALDHPDASGVRFAIANPATGQARVDDDKRSLLEALLADPKAAAIEYGHRTGSCCVCGRTLTNPESVAAGIGPICAGRF